MKKLQIYIFLLCILICCLIGCNRRNTDVMIEQTSKEAGNEITVFERKEEIKLFVAVLEKYLIPKYGVASASNFEVTHYYKENYSFQYENEKALALSDIIGIHDVFIDDYNNDNILDMLVAVGVCNDIWKGGVRFCMLHYSIDDA